HAARIAPDWTRADCRAAATIAGRDSASNAAAPATTAAATLEPLTAANRGAPSSSTPGSDVMSPTPGAAMSGFGVPSNASPPDENGATVPRSGLAPIDAAPTDNSPGPP